MTTLYLGILLFLFALAVCDLCVGVVGSSVPFMSPGMGSKAAKFKTLVTVAAIGIFVGAATSNGMMDVARHGIMNPDYFAFDDVVCIALTVTAADIILLDIFNTLSLPTSTTVSMVFGLLGSSTGLALFKSETFANLINTDKALTIIISIFMSVAIAFVFGLFVMWLARVIFTFDYKHRSRWFRPIFGGVSITCIVYFLLIIGTKGTTLVPEAAQQFIDNNTAYILLGCFIAFSAMTLLLDFLRVNIFRVIVLFGTFSLAMAFAGNDLVNFIGVPLSALEAFIDFKPTGADPMTYTMNILSKPSANEFFNSLKPFFLIGSGIIMVIALATSTKARKVVENTNSLASQGESEEIFSSSKIARSLVRAVLNMNAAVSKWMPKKLQNWINVRFDSDATDLPEGANFDLLRASINLVLAGFLIVAGTSLQLPLSTTYVAFMVGMGSSLADRAWGRETAVYRITGVFTVVGGWFITAGAAFMLSLLLAVVCHLTGFIGMIAVCAIVAAVLIHNNRKFKKKQEQDTVDTVFRQLVRSKDKHETWQLLEQHVTTTQVEMVNTFRESFRNITNGVMHENIRQLRQAAHDIDNAKNKWKRYRRKEIVGMRRIDYLQAVEKNTWFHLGSNNTTQSIYCLKRMLEPALEHVDNNFNPLPNEDVEEFIPICNSVDALLQRTSEMIESGNFKGSDELLVEGNALKSQLSQLRHSQQDHLQREENNIRTAMLYLNMLQETQELISMTRHLLRAAKRFQQ